MYNATLIYRYTEYETSGPPILFIYSINDEDMLSQSQHLITAPAEPTSKTPHWLAQLFPIGAGTFHGTLS